MSTTQAPTHVHTILLATDFSAIAERAGEYAVRLAQQLEVPLEIGHVMAPPDDEWDEISWHTERERRGQRLHTWSVELQKIGIRVHSAISTDCPAPLAISLLQKRSGADLLVLGTESKSTLDRFLLGSTAEALIREGSVPVLTVGPRARPPHADGTLFRKMVLATDFSPASERAERLAIDLAHHFAAKLYVLHLDRACLPDNAGARFHAEMAFRNKLMQDLPPDRFEIRNAECGVGSANVSDSIVQYAADTLADLIIMGARERSFWLLHVRRGVTQDVLAAAECPVLTAR